MAAEAAVAGLASAEQEEWFPVAEQVLAERVPVAEPEVAVVPVAAVEQLVAKVMMEVAEQAVVAV